MVQCKVFDVRWIWRYRLCYVAGITIMSIQVFLAVIFFTLYEDVDKGSRISRSNYALMKEVRTLYSYSLKTVSFQFISSHVELTGGPS